MLDCDFLKEVGDRWQDALKTYLADPFADPDVTYRAVLAAGGLFGPRVGAILDNAPALRQLRDALRGFPCTRHQHRCCYVENFITLGMCDLAVNLVDDSAYASFAKALGQNESFFASMADETRRFQRALLGSGIVPVHSASNGHILYINSLCHFVPAYRIRTEALQNLVHRLVEDLADEWLRTDAVPDPKQFREQVSQLMARHASAQRVGSMLDPLRRLLDELRRAFHFALQLEDFDAYTPDEFAVCYQRSHGQPLLAGQPLELEGLWPEFRGLLGAHDGTRRTGPRGLAERVERGEVTAMPDTALRRPRTSSLGPSTRSPGASTGAAMASRCSSRASRRWSGPAKH